MISRPSAPRFLSCGVNPLRTAQLSGQRANDQGSSVCVCAQWLNCVRFFVTPWTVAHQAPLSMEFSRQEYWSGLPFPSPGELPDPGIESVSLEFPALAGRFFTTASPGSYHQMLSSALWQLQSIPVSLQMVSVLGLTATAVHVGESPQLDSCNRR